MYYIDEKTNGGLRFIRFYNYDLCLHFNDSRRYRYRLCMRYLNKCLSVSSR